MADSKGYIRSMDEKGSINISEEVISIIAGAAATEVEGVHGLFISYGKEVTTVTGKKGLSKGIRISTDGEQISIDVYIMVNIGTSVGEVSEKVQKKVASAVEGAVGINISAVNIHVCGMAPEKQAK
jgi:uncharacterized alkaline shock family protein YloU